MNIDQSGKLQPINLREMILEDEVNALRRLFSLMYNYNPTQPMGAGKAAQFRVIMADIESCRHRYHTDVAKSNSSNHNPVVSTKE